MNKATPFVVALGIAMMAVPTAYHYSPEKQLEIPASVSRKVEHLAPLAERPVVKKSVPKPKAVVTQIAKKPALTKKRVQPAARSRQEPRAKQDFATDLRSLQDCKKLDALRTSGQDVKTQYQARLKAALIPWYLRNCIFT